MTTPPHANMTRQTLITISLTKAMMAVVSLFGTSLVPAAEVVSDTPALVWDGAEGVLLQTPVATVKWDQNDQLATPVLEFAACGELALRNPRVTQPSAKQLNLAYELTTPDGTTLQVTRELTLTLRDGQTELVETFRLTPSKPLTTDLEIRRPVTISGTKPASAASAVCPLFNGWAKPYPLAEQPLEVDYRLGNVLRGQEQLALPVIQLDSQNAWRAALSADCRFSALFSVSAVPGRNVQAEVRYRYSCDKVPLKGAETRSFGLWLVPGPPADEPFGKSVDSFFRLMLPEVPPGPKWLHEIAMVYYDYLSENSQGWERDVNELARLLKPEERRRVALCFHGWYESIGGYGYDEATGKMKTEWTAMERTRKVAQSPSDAGGSQAPPARRKAAWIPRLVVFRRRHVAGQPGAASGLLPSGLELSRRRRELHRRLAGTGYLGPDVRPQSRAPGGGALVQQLSPCVARRLWPRGGRLRLGRDLPHDAGLDHAPSRAGFL